MKFFRYLTTWIPLHVAIALVATTICAPMGSLHAEGNDSVLGLWRTFDEKSGKPWELVRIDERGGVVFGTLEKSFNAQDQDKICSKCTDDRLNKPLIGIQLIRNMHREDGSYEGGDILDAYSGTVYKCSMKLLDGGRKLTVRAYVGIALMGRSLIWERVD